MVEQEQEKQERRSRKDVEAQIIAKAWADEAFMEKLRTDPKATISAELGRELPDSLSVVIHQETRDDPTWHLVVPPAPSDELDDEAMDAVAGGDVGQGDTVYSSLFSAPRRGENDYQILF